MTIVKCLILAVLVQHIVHATESETISTYTVEQSRDLKEKEKEKENPPNPKVYCDIKQHRSKKQYVSNPDDVLSLPPLSLFYMGESFHQITRRLDGLFYCECMHDEISPNKITPSSSDILIGNSVCGEFRILSFQIPHYSNGKLWSAENEEEFILRLTGHRVWGKPMLPAGWIARIQRYHYDYDSLNSNDKPSVIIFGNHTFSNFLQAFSTTTILSKNKQVEIMSLNDARHKLIPFFKKIIDTRAIEARDHCVKTNAYNNGYESGKQYTNSQCENRLREHGQTEFQRGIAHANRTWLQERARLEQQYYLKGYQEATTNMATANSLNDRNQNQNQRNTDQDVRGNPPPYEVLHPYPSPPPYYDDDEL